MNIDLQPILKDERITLRPIRESDLEELSSAASDPLIWEQHPVPDRYLKENFTPYFLEAVRSKSGFAVIDNETGRLIGNTRFYDWNPSAKSIAIGYTFLERKYWGGVFNKAMKALLLDHCFRNGIETVLFHIGIDNKRSQKALEKIGGIRIGSVEREGRPYFEFEITREKWNIQTI
ncbi:N-acetyltransferase [Leptospira gomenensis]|uniref:N-acetyltransferase n=1 Tax=Leptospira gomenensis TaxID=2484974 RepID=A0A5F1Z207_9LEPT|nr:GNAT family N-acetyltransferase [Leptospira gomenensis]TGK29004.1 N-acetyltransferase [Leptospira gomenensis]TGK44971.1 N-acetyltransferase [Leptospira gomenensis]TGK51892.1 N-acetyltransferase [Leptospira gomenensis]TGK67300.1 N-acetyltransferase [Leptospira gomenensis]